MMMLLLGDDNAALKSKAEYTIICNAVTGADQAACQAEINNLYDAAGALIIDCATITDATAKAACETNQKTIAKKLAGFGTSGGLLGGDNKDLLLLMMLGGGMGAGTGLGSGMGSGMDSLLPLLLLGDGNLLGSGGKLDIKTLLLMQMMNGGQLFNSQAPMMGSMNPLMMFLLLK